MTVVSLTSASPLPSGLIVDSWGTWTSTPRPVGVLPALPSGVTLSVGAKLRSSQPESSGSVACSVWTFSPGRLPGSVVKLPGSSQSSTLNVAVRGTLQEVGFVNSGTTGTSIGHSPRDSSSVWNIPSYLSSWLSATPPLLSSPRQFPRSLSWLASAGTPQIFTVEASTASVWGMLRTLTVTP